MSEIVENITFRRMQYVWKLRVGEVLFPIMFICSASTQNMLDCWNAFTVFMHMQNRVYTKWYCTKLKRTNVHAYHLLFIVIHEFRWSWHCTQKTRPTSYQWRHSAFNSGHVVYSTTVHVER